MKLILKHFLLWWIMYTPLKVIFDLVMQTQKRGNWKTRGIIFIQSEMCCDNCSPDLNLSLWHQYHFTENWQYREQRQCNPPCWKGSNILIALTCTGVPAWALDICWQHSWVLYLLAEEKSPVERPLLVAFKIWIIIKNIYWIITLFK